MNLASQQDFTRFLEFVDTFSLHAIADDATKATVIRRAHTQFLALLTTTSELLPDTGSVCMEFSNAYGEFGQKYLREVVSDCSEFIMCVLLGLYRSAGGTLRSAIESYLKAFASKDRPLILQRTSVPEVFNDAAQASFFPSQVGVTVIAELKGVYTDLNAYVHTASEGHMFSAPAVGGFPRWSEKSQKLVDIFVRVIRLLLYGIVGSRRDLYDRFDHRNKVITNRAMTRVQRRSALGVDD